MRNKIWLGVIIAGWATVAAASSILDLRREIAPATQWLDVKSVHVYDTWEGEPPFMTVNRVIRQPFVGEWFATVRTISDGSNSFACLTEGRASYAVDAAMPGNLSLDWWTHPVKCRMPPGRYRLDTIWIIRPAGYPEKALFTQSNVFEVHPHYRASPH